MPYLDVDFASPSQGKRQVKRSFRHWTPRYVVNRVRWQIDQKLRPNDPWLTRDAIGILQQILRKPDHGLEFGSGRSTKWFASRMAHLTSIEHDREWYGRVSREIADIENVDYRFADIENSEDGEAEAGYTRIYDEFGENALDFILVDGKFRAACARKALAALRPGGILVIDNVNWFLPGKTSSPNSVASDREKIDPAWQEVDAALEHWRCIWTTNHVNDTAIFIKV